MSSPNCQLFSTLFWPHLLHPLQTCSTRTLSDIRLMFRHYLQNKTKTHKSIKTCKQVKNLILYRYSVFSTSTLLAHSPYLLHSLIHIIRQRKRKMHMKPYLHISSTLRVPSSSSSFYIMLHIIRDKYVYVMVCFKLLYT